MEGGSNEGSSTRTFEFRNHLQQRLSGSTLAPAYAPENERDTQPQGSPKSESRNSVMKEAPKAGSETGKSILNGLESKRAIIKSMSQDKNGNLVGFCALHSEARSDRGGQDLGDIFLFHGAEAEGGLKSGFGAGNVESAGLQLETGDLLGELRVQDGPKGLKLVSATLVDLASRSTTTRLTNYLLSIEKAVADLRRREVALQCLRQRSACTAILNAVAALPDPTESVINLLEVLVQASCPGSGSTGKTSTAALETVLASKLTLPGQHLENLLQGTRCTDKKLRARLVGIVLQAFRVSPLARRRLFLLLSAFLHANPHEAHELLPPARLVPLLAVFLPEDDQLGCYHWRELPLHLLPAEMRTQGVLSSKRDDLQAVKKKGEYRDFEEYMATYVGLLREEAFAGMRQGLGDLLGGKLDSRDMLVIPKATLLAMSPPSTSGGGSAQGTVLELRAKSTRTPPPMFGSLLAVAPRLSFDKQAVWATVAGATYNQREKELCIYAELCPGLNDGTDSQILAGLLRNSGALTIVESPAFYRAYAPAICALQAMQPQQMPFAQEILYGRDPGVAESVPDIKRLVDPSAVFQAVGAKGETVQLPLVTTDDLIKALGYLSPSASPATPLHPKALVAEVPVGARVRVFGLTAFTQYNESRGVISEVRIEGGETERFVVLLDEYQELGGLQQSIVVNRESICVDKNSETSLGQQSPHVRTQPKIRLLGRNVCLDISGVMVKLTTTLDPSQCEALKAVLTQRIAIIRGPPGTGKTFIGVRALRLLLSAVEDSAGLAGGSAESESSPGPALLLTYKNVALDDFLNECVRLWPDGVARIGGKAEGVLEQRHLGALLRNARRTDEHMAARSVASEKREGVEAAAQAMAQQRFFSADSLFAACAGNCGPQWGCAACRFLHSLLLHDPTSLSPEDDRAAASAELQSRAKNQDSDALFRRVSGVLRLWVPSNKECAKVCRSSAALPADQDARLAAQGSLGSEVGQSEEAEQENQERSRYSWFESSSVRLDHEPAADRGCRKVFELVSGNEMAETEAHELLSTENVWDLTGERKVLFMHALVRSLFLQAAARYDAAMGEYSLASETLRGLDVRHQADVLQQMKVVGMTISGASIQRDLLEVLKPRIVFVEEAGEVLEPLLLAALGPWVQRLVLIGDDKQLPPQVNSHVLARDFHFNTSLMSRLVQNQLQHQSLSFQARMMPEFAALLTDVYPEYKTSDRVLCQDRQSPPPGVVPAMFFWDVESTVPEKDSSGRSHVNRSEVECVTALAVHLVRSGVAPKQITLLAPYAGQVQALRDAVRGPLAAVHQGGWPKPGSHDVAADNQLKTLSAQVGAGMAGTGTGQQCISVGETMLKLGRIEDAQRAFVLVAKRASVRSGEEGDELLSSASKHLERIRMLLKTTEDVENLLGGQITSLELNQAISAIKALEEVWTRWRTSSVAAAAAAAHLQAVLAVQIRDAAAAVSQKGLNDKQSRLLDAMNRSASERLKELASQEEVCVCSIDRYQGSENDYVIVSLVRCNSSGDIGFLRERARRVVAQSRARLGMYFVGSRTTMEKTEHWRWLCDQMKARKCLGPTLRLTCPKHPGSPRDVSARTDDLKAVVERGVCGQKCEAPMGCGIHQCQRPCHGDTELAVQHHLVCEVMMDDFCSSGKHSIRRKCAQSTADVKCLPCQRIEKERLERQERERDARARAEREETERLVQESRRIEKAERERKLEEKRVLEQQQKAEVDRIIAEIKLKPQQLRKEELKPHGEHALEFLSVMDRTEKYVQTGFHESLSVHRIEKVINMELEAHFLVAKKQLHSGILNCNMQLLFHGTGQEGVEGISKTGFRLPPQSEDNMFGRGVYFATDSSKSAQHMYTKGSGCVLLCEVLIGKCCEVKGLASSSPLSTHVKTSSKGRPYLDVDQAKMKAAGFDSVFAPRDTRDAQGVQFDEMIVFDPAQAIVRYIVHFSNGASNPQWSNAGKLIARACGVTVRTISASSLQGSQDSRELREFNFACGNFTRLMGGTCSKAVTRVDVYDSAAVKRAHRDKENEFKQLGKSTSKRWVFHGTTQSNVAKICSEGFKVGGSNGIPIQNGALYGNGVYTAIGPKTPMSYSNGSSIILCSGMPGKEGRACSDVAVDSWPGRPGDDWMIFKTADQLLPQYVVHFG